MSDVIPKDLRPAFPVHVPKDAVRSKLLALLGLDAIPQEVDFTERGTQEEEGIRVTELTYANSIGETVPGVIMTPLNASGQKLPGIVCVPGTGGSAEKIAHQQFYLAEDPPGMLIGWARELARRGFATLAISPKGSVTRRPDIEHWNLEGKLLTPYGRPQMGILVEETLRAARILAANERVDSDSIGITGMSLGGNATWYAMAAAPWIRAGAPICGGLGRMVTLIHEGDIERHSAYFFIPHMLRYFDHPEVVAACIAPRPLMMVAPTEDEDMPRKGVDELIQVVVPVYASAGHPERFKVYQPDGNHRFLPEYFEWMGEWFDQFLRGKTT
jgi:dienelactone hydrolase